MVSINSFNDHDLLILIVFSGIFGASIVFANIAAGIKLVDFFGFIVPAGTIAYSITFPITDIVDEIYGKRRAVYIVWAGLFAEIAMLILIGAEAMLPALEQDMQIEYIRIFTPQLRIVLASIVAYLISQHHDVWAFWKWREITKGKYLWIRNNASTMVSQFLDSTIFILIAFYGIESINVLLNMIMSMWLFKVLIAALDTPFVYLGVSFVKRYTLKQSLRLIGINDVFQTTE